jgi:RNA polymerase sigma-70 factor (ECF subfamily)
MTEEDIIKMIRTGGAAMNVGVKALYAEAAQPFLRFFVYKGSTSEEAKDVLQETMVKIVRSVESFGGEGSAKSWMWQIARNCLIDHQRKTGALTNHETTVSDEHWQYLEEVTSDPTATVCNDNSFVDECVTAGLDVFGKREPERALVLLLQMDGHSIEEIGLRIGRTIAATKEYLSQCKKKIQPYIAHCIELLST